MTFAPFSTNRLAEGETSPPIEFVVLLDAEQTFIRVIAHSEEAGLHGGNPPTVLIKAGLGDPTAVDEGAGPVDILGSGNAVVATATCERTAEDADTFLITIDHTAASGPWLLQIRNNEPEALAFNGFISHEERETLQPWLEIHGVPSLGGVGRTRAGIEMRNLGTDTLTIDTEPGDQIGDDAFPVTFEDVPDSVELHRLETLSVECPPLDEVVSATPRTFHVSLETNDPDPSHERFSVRVQQPELPAHFCREFDGCRDFVPRPDPDEDQCETCFHHANSHGMNIPIDTNPF